MIPPHQRVLGPSGRMRRYRVAGEASSSEADGERFQASEREALAVLRTGRGQRELRQPLHERVDGDLALHARERGAEAEVDAPAEGDVAVVGARDVETVGVGKLCGVAVGGADE